LSTGLKPQVSESPKQTTVTGSFFVFDIVEPAQVSTLLKSRANYVSASRSAAFNFYRVFIGDQGLPGKSRAANRKP
jgi:hypothetical protein